LDRPWRLAPDENDKSACYDYAIPTHDGKSPSTAAPFRSAFSAFMFAPMNHEAYNDTYIRGILNSVKTIAMVGFSPKENRPSYFAFKYLLERGYRMIPVNPGQAGKSVLGQKIYARLSDIPEPVDMVDIFRGSEHVLPVVAEALTLKPKPQVIWMQLTIRNDAAAKLAEDAGLKVVMNRCPKIEYGRLSSEISWMGVNSKTLSSKRPQTLGAGVQRLRLGPAKGNGDSR
jgi:uncharacterized protein